MFAYISSFFPSHTHKNVELKIFSFFVCIGIIVKRLGVEKNIRDFCNIKAKNGAHSICKIC